MPDILVQAMLCVLFIGESHKHTLWTTKSTTKRRLGQLTVVKFLYEQKFISKRLKLVCGIGTNKLTLQNLFHNFGTFNLHPIFISVDNILCRYLPWQNGVETSTDEMGKHKYQGRYLLNTNECPLLCAEKR